MLASPLIFIALILSAIICLITFLVIKSKIKKSQLKTIFLLDLTNLLICLIGIILQCSLGNILSIPLIYYDYIVYIGTCFLPVSVFFTGLIFANTKIKFKASYILLFIIPILSLIILWTNDVHHLFYINYSLNLSENIVGPYYNIHFIYTYIMYALGLIYLLKYSIKNSGFFSRQALLFIVSALIPIIINILASFKIISADIYLTPISFAATILLLAFAIFKFNFLSVTPIALQRIVDRISDSFIVLNEEDIIIDFNETFLNTFNLSSSNVRRINFIDFIKNNSNEVNLDPNQISDAIKKSKNSNETITFANEYNIMDKYFNIEISSINSKGNFLGTLILLKDVTQHVNDVKTIQANQDLLVEKERLASLGQMIGGIAHNLKTPIMSVAGAVEGLSDLTKEYDISIGDPSVTNEDHHEIVKDMNNWIEKIKTHISYMSDVITAVKGQAVAFSEQPSDTFTLNELLKYIDVLMKHELKNALIELNINLKVDSNLSIRGNINSLVQVINNIISNSIQAYNGKPNQNIDFTIYSNSNDLIFSIEDYGCGMSKEVQDKLFKEMITTKGKNGTGLGLFMSYSNIRAHFNGDIKFTSHEGKGAKFDVIIPIN